MLEALCDSSVGLASRWSRSAVSMSGEKRVVRGGLS
jgi:hypothetical protein